MKNKHGKVNLLVLKTSAGIGGAEQILYYLVKFIDRTIFRPYVLIAEDGPLVQRIRECNAEVSVLPLKGMTGVFRLHKLISFLQEKNIHLIHAHGARTNFYGCLASLWTGVPIVSHEHNMDAWRQDNHLWNLIDAFSSRVNVRRIGVCSEVSTMLREKVGVPPEKIVTINNAIDPELYDFKAAATGLKEALGIPSGNKVIGVVANLHQQKGHLHLLAAARTVVAEFPAISLLLVGEGKLRLELQQYTAACELNGQVIFTGTRTDIPALLSIVDIYVMPSLWEGLPLALLEAMAMKKPVVATRVCGIPNVVEDGKEGFLVPPQDEVALADKILYLLKRPELCLQMGENGRRKVEEKFNARLMVKAYERTFLEILSTAHSNEEYR